MWIRTLIRFDQTRAFRISCTAWDFPELISSLVPDQTHDSQIAHQHVVLGCPDAEPTLGIRLRVYHLEYLFRITPVLDEISVCDQSDGLRFVWVDPFGWLL